MNSHALLDVCTGAGFPMFFRIYYSLFIGHTALDVARPFKFELTLALRAWVLKQQLELSLGVSF